MAAAPKTEPVSVSLSLDVYAMLEVMKEERKNQNRSAVVEDAVKAYYEDWRKKKDAATS